MKDARGDGSILVTWTVLRTSTALRLPPWVPVGATYWQSGHSSPGDARPPEASGFWWSVVATWDDPAAAAAGPQPSDGVAAWHLVVEPISASGDVAPWGAAHAHHPERIEDRLDGPAALITVAGHSPDTGREREFFRRFLHVSRDISGAPGHLLSLVHAPAGDSETGPVLTLSV